MGSRGEIYVLARLNHRGSITLSKEIVLLISRPPVYVFSSIATHGGVANNGITNGGPDRFSDWCPQWWFLRCTTQVESFARASPIIGFCVGHQRHLDTLGHSLLQGCCLALMLIVFCWALFNLRLFLVF